MCMPLMGGSSLAVPCMLSTTTCTPHHAAPATNTPPAAYDELHQAAEAEEATGAAAALRAKAQHYLLRSLNLAQSLWPKTFVSEPWHRVGCLKQKVWRRHVRLPNPGLCWSMDACPPAFPAAPANFPAWAHPQNCRSCWPRWLAISSASGQKMKRCRWAGLGVKQGAGFKRAPARGEGLKQSTASAKLPACWQLNLSCWCAPVSHGRRPR